MRQLSTATNLTQQVAAAVRDAIGSGELRTGDLYSVQQIADRLDVSRTPVREALLGLADAGLVRFERNRGFRVIRHDPHQIAEMFAMRILLEVPFRPGGACHVGARHRSGGRARVDARSRRRPRRTALHGP
ncbi:MAG: GntR family transcriptional regulator [Nocardioidaceae bacterium]